MDVSQNKKWKYQAPKPIKHKCKQCNVEYVAHPLKKYCGQKCRSRFHYEKVEGLSKFESIRKGLLEAIEWKKSRLTPEQRLKYKDRYKGTDSNHVGKKCNWCGDSFSGHFNKKYCSNRCKNKFYEKRYGRRDNPAKKRVWEKEYRKMKKEKGLCKSCYEPAISNSRCKFHMQDEMKRNRKRKAKRNYGPLWEHNILINDITNHTAFLPRLMIVRPIEIMRADQLN